MSRGPTAGVVTATARSFVAQRRTHSRLIVVLAVVAAVALGVTVVVWQLPSDGDIAGEAVVTTSSTAPGFSAPDIVTGSASAPGVGWRSDGQTTGAWVQLAWPQEHVVSQIVIVRNSLDEPGATDGFLSFGDGSFLQVRLSSADRSTTVPIAPRSTDRVRFSASAVSPGASSVAIRQIQVNAQHGDVVTGDTPDGNAASRAALRQSPDSSASDPAALRDGSGAPGDAGAGADWTVATPQGAWVELRWDHPREFSSIELIGSPRSSAALAKATVTFSDGGTLPMGAVTSDPARPTTVAFMPRVTTSVRLTIDGVSGSGPLALGELRTYERGATPVRWPSRGAAPAAAPNAATCSGLSSAAPSSGLVISCPEAGSSVGDTADLRVVAAAGYTAVSAAIWPADAAAAPDPQVHAAPDPTGVARLRADVAGQPAGPFTVAVVVTGPGQPTRTAYLPLYHRATPAGNLASSAAASGRTMAYAEEFDRPVSLTRTGSDADYAAGKPTAGGAEDFGDAIFADPARGGDTVGVADDSYLRIAVEPSTTDPQGWGRTHAGGLLASARMGGSGFSAQYGYFEARMFAPAAPGTWPAFWMLPSDGLVAPTTTGAEIDAVELYGQNPTGACHSTHQYQSGKNVDGVARCGQRFPTVRAALAWHTYGVSITPTENVFFIDGKVVATAPQVADGGSPMFFLVDLALGGGWPVDLHALQDRTALYVDYVRVYV